MFRKKPGEPVGLLVYLLPSSDPDGRVIRSGKWKKELRRLQAELCKLQDWVKKKSLRVIVVSRVAALRAEGLN